MNIENVKMIRALIVSALSIFLTPLAVSQTFSPYVDADGNISLPADFRASMVHLGSWFVPAGGASGFHDVYTESASVEAYRQTGEFPDGATLIKELRAANSGDFTTGQDVSYATNEIKQWFVMVRDSKNRFPGNPLWGEGWGWALYKPNEPNKNIARNFQTDCLGCHVPAKAQGWVYTQAYPTLQTNR